MKARAREFRGRTTQVFNQTTPIQYALNFASELGPERVINVTTSMIGTLEIIRVWYWQDESAVQKVDALSNRRKES